MTSSSTKWMLIKQISLMFAANLTQVKWHTNKPPTVKKGDEIQRKMPGASKHVQGIHPLNHSSPLVLGHCRSAYQLAQCWSEDPMIAVSPQVIQYCIRWYSGTRHINQCCIRTDHLPNQKFWTLGSGCQQVKGGSIQIQFRQGHPLLIDTHENAPSLLT